MVFYGYHGVAPEEKHLGQRFIVDLDVGLDLAPAGKSDDVSKTVNYAALFRQVRDIVEGPPCNLLECVAERIAAAVLAEHPLETVRVRIRKPSAPVKGGVFTSAGVEIERSRARLADENGQGGRPST